jgi:hypothetical protein
MKLLPLLSLLAYTIVTLLSGLLVTYVLIEYLASCGETYYDANGNQTPYTCVFTNNEEV